MVNYKHIEIYYIYIYIYIYEVTNLKIYTLQYINNYSTKSDIEMFSIDFIKNNMEHWNKYVHCLQIFQSKYLI
jgi:hypothetical protein